MHHTYGARVCIRLFDCSEYERRVLFRREQMAGVMRFFKYHCALTVCLSLVLYFIAQLQPGLHDRCPVDDPIYLNESHAIKLDRPSPWWLCAHGDFTAYPKEAFEHREMIAYGYLFFRRDLAQPVLTRIVFNCWWRLSTRSCYRTFYPYKVNSTDVLYFFTDQSASAHDRVQWREHWTWRGFRIGVVLAWFAVMAIWVPLILVLAFLVVYILFITAVLLVFATVHLFVEGVRWMLPQREENDANNTRYSE